MLNYIMNDNNELTLDFENLCFW